MSVKVLVIVNVLRFYIYKMQLKKIWTKTLYLKNIEYTFIIISTTMVVDFIHYAAKMSTILGIVQSYP